MVKVTLALMGAAVMLAAAIDVAACERQLLRDKAFPIAEAAQLIEE